MRKLSWFNTLTLTLGFAFLYIPMLILILYSFNAGKLVTVWSGFSFKWYGELFQNEAFLNAAWVTLKVAVVSSTFATILGTMAAYVMVSGTHAVLWHDLRPACDARSDHRPIAAVVVHCHRSGPRRADHCAGAYHLFNVLRVCCGLFAPCDL